MLSKKTSKLFILCLLLLSCEDSKTKARKDLNDLGVRFDTQVFVKHVRESDFVVARLFLQSGMIPDSDEALYYAVNENNHKMVSLLFKYGANPKIGNAFINSINKGNIDIIKLFIKNGAEINRRYEASYIFSGQSQILPVVAAIELDNFDIAKYLFSNGASLDNFERDGVPLSDIYGTDKLKAKDLDLWYEVVGWEKTIEDLQNRLNESIKKNKTNK